MAKRPIPSNLRFASESLRAVNNALNEIRQTREQSRQLIRTDDRAEQKELTPSQILAQYNASNNLAIAQEKEAERIKFGMTPLEYKRYDSRVSSERARSAAGLARIASKEKVELEKRQIANAEKLSQMQDEVEGAGYLPSLIRGEFPATKTTFSTAADIDIVPSNEDAPDRKKVGAFFTFDDIEYMYKNGDFARAGISDEEFVNTLKLNIDGLSDVQTDEDVAKVQEMLFKFLKSSSGSGLRNAMKMEFQEKVQPQITNIYGGNFPSLSDNILGRGLNNMETTVQDTFKEN